MKESIAKLTTSVENLEASVQLLEESKARADSEIGKQQDMFNGTGKAVVERVDKAIKNVENLLGEA